MVSIRSIRQRKRDAYVHCSLELKGHAGLGFRGQDPLCAAVSVLTENLANSLATLLRLPLHIKEEKGLYIISLAPKHASEASDLLFATTLLGLGVLAKQYPDRIEITERKEGKEGRDGP